MPALRLPQARLRLPKRAKRRAAARLLLSVLVVILALMPVAAAAHAEPAAQGIFSRGTVIGLRGTPHLWIVDDFGVLHWGGDTRALAGRWINWGSRVEVPLDVLRSLPRADPWLSSGLLKDGIPIYLVKWEMAWPRPELWHIQSIADVEIFGIDASNYGTFVLDKVEWERRYGLDADRLARLPLPPAVPTAVPSPHIVLADNFDDASGGVLPSLSPDPTRYARGYEAGEYALKIIDPRATWSGALLPAVYDNASIAVDVRLLGSTVERNVSIWCRRTSGGSGYYLNLDVTHGRLVLVRYDDGARATAWTWHASSSIRRGNATNRVELSCVGAAIAARINGTLVTSMQDSTHKEGRFSLNVWTLAGSNLTAEARFDNLEVWQ